jgi:hypothetical protein
LKFSDEIEGAGRNDQRRCCIRDRVAIGIGDGAENAILIGRRGQSLFLSTKNCGRVSVKSEDQKHDTESIEQSHANIRQNKLVSDIEIQSNKTGVLLLAVG